MNCAPTSTPVSYTHLDVYKRQAEYNAIFTELAQEKRVYLLDPAPLFTDENGDLRAELTDDGVHLNLSLIHI